jgi:hypothetical protein
MSGLLLLLLHLWLQLTPGRGAVLPKDGQLLWEAAWVPAGFAVSARSRWCPRKLRFPLHWFCHSFCPGVPTSLELTVPDFWTLGFLCAQRVRALE